MLSHALIAHIKPCALNLFVCWIFYVTESVAKLAAILTWGPPAVCCLVRA